MSGRGGKRGGVGCTGLLLAVLVVAMLASLFGQAAIDFRTVMTAWLIKITDA